MNVFYAENGSYYDIVYDGECKRRFYKKKGLVCSFILAKKIIFLWRTSLPIITLSSIVLSDPEDEHEYASAKFMFAPNPAFFLPCLAFVFFIFLLGMVYPYEHAEFLLLLIPPIAINLIVSYLMTRKFQEYVTNGFYGSSGLKTLPCSFWRTTAIYVLSMFAVFGPAITLMQGTDQVKPGAPNTGS